MCKKVYFKDQKQFGDITFKANTTYYLKDVPAGFVERWVKRGCEVVEEVKGEFLADPRHSELSLPDITKKVKEPVKEVKEPVKEVKEEKKPKKKAKKKFKKEE